jgi:hypothetical protein
MKWLLMSSLIVTGVSLAAPGSDFLAPFATPAFLFLGLSLAVVPAAHGVARFFKWQRQSARRFHAPQIAATLAACTGVGLVVWASAKSKLDGWGLRPLEVGLVPELAAVISPIQRFSQNAGRILWEDSSGDACSRAIVLLPLLTHRHFIGGHAAGDSDNAYANLSEGKIGGRSISAWSDTELDAFCRRYNIGWIVAATNDTTKRLDRWPLAEFCTTAGPRRLYQLQRPLSFVLKGSANEVKADRVGITLSDVIPEQGEVVLSFHYHEGLRARPSWVRIEREPDPYDPVPLIRLQMSAPAARVTLSWNRP